MVPLKGHVSLRRKEDADEHTDIKHEALNSLNKAFPPQILDVICVAFLSGKNADGKRKLIVSMEAKVAAASICKLCNTKCSSHREFAIVVSALSSEVQVPAYCLLRVNE